MKKHFNPFRLVPYVLVLTLFVCAGFSQITWQRTYGGAGIDYGRSGRQTTDGGYIVVGHSNSFGNDDQVYLIKTDSLGDTLWTKTYGGSGVDWGLSVQQTTDGGYIIGGYTNSFGDSFQIYLIKTDSLGDTLWTRIYGDSLNDYGYSVQQTQDGGYIVVGAAMFAWGYDPVYLIKTDSLGNIIWSKSYIDTSGNITGRSVQQTTDGGYIIAGSHNHQVLLIKTDSLGNTLWIKTYYRDGWSEGFSVQQTNDGGYIVTGQGGMANKVYLVKTDSLGDTLWTRIYEASSGYDVDAGYSVQQTTDEGYIITGYYNYYNYYTQVYLIKTDSLGDTLWTRTYGPMVTESKGYSVQQTLDGGYIIAGRSYAQVYLIKTDQDGNVAGLEETNRFRYLSNRPSPIVSLNPFSSFTTVIGYEKERFILYDISGRQVGSYLGNRIGFGLPAGVYFLMPEDKSFKPVRIVKVK